MDMSSQTETLIFTGQENIGDCKIYDEFGNRINNIKEIYITIDALTKLFQVRVQYWKYNNNSSELIGKTFQMKNIVFTTK